MKLRSVEADWPWRAFLTCLAAGKLFIGVPPLFTSMRLAWAHSHGKSQGSMFGKRRQTSTPLLVS